MEDPLGAGAASAAGEFSRANATMTLGWDKKPMISIRLSALLAVCEEGGGVVVFGARDLLLDAFYNRLAL